MTSVSCEPIKSDARKRLYEHGRAFEVSVIIPVYNEEGTLRRVLEELLIYSGKCEGGSFEIIVVDDGSTDDSRVIAETFAPMIRVVANPRQRGYGSALVAGVDVADAQYVVFFDSDGQHTIKGLDAVLEHHGAFDMIVGARRRFRAPLVRSLGRSVIRRFASYLAGSSIPDLNSGLRVVNRDKFREFQHLYPSGFSLSSTVTLAFFKRGYSVSYVPIDVEPRTCGRSTVKVVRDGALTLALMVRLIMLFAPQKIFLPIAASCFVIGITSFIVEMHVAMNIGENTTLLLVSSLLVLLFGLLADQIAAIRREMRAH